MNLHNYKGVVIQPSWKGTKEGIAVHMTCLLYKIQVRFGWNATPYKSQIDNRDFINNYEIPVGDVFFCPRWINKTKHLYERRDITPNYYPESLSKYISRKITVKRTMPKVTSFIKPLTYKSFTGFVYDPKTSDFEINKPFKIICSEVVNFVEEWRYYITDGKVVYSSWYKGKSEECDVLPDAPQIDVPEGFYGTIDMGITDKGQLELVECHHPYSCGWYGRLIPDEMEIYTQWLFDGQKYIDSM